MANWYPFFVLLVGLAVVIGGIVAFRLHAFLSLITASMVVSLLVPGEWGEKISRVAEGFGSTAAGVGVVIALAAIIGKALTDSGAADRIVLAFIRLLGEKRCDVALASSGFTLAIPVFFDTVFYLLVPLAQSTYRRTGKHYVRYLVAVASCAIAHVLIPPTPGPLVIAGNLGVDLGVMMIVGCVVALPAALAGLFFASWIDRRVVIESPPMLDDELSNSLSEDDLPSLLWSVAPIVLPVLLITFNTAFKALAEVYETVAGYESLGQAFAVLGNPNFALLLSTAIALYTYWRYRHPTREQLGDSIETALMSGGVIVLITAAGGAFGAMLKEAEIAPAIQGLFGDSAVEGFGLLLLAFFIAALIKFAQGSSTAAMIVTSAMFAAMIESVTLNYHTVYLATAIGSGSLVGSWMNDSGFWIFSKMGGLTELETLKTWTPLLAILGVVSMAMTLLMAVLLPLV